MNKAEEAIVREAIYNLTCGAVLMKSDPSWHVSKAIQVLKKLLKEDDDETD